MKPKSSLKKSPVKAPAERVVKDIRRAARAVSGRLRPVRPGLWHDDRCHALRKEHAERSRHLTSRIVDSNSPPRGSARDVSSP